MMLSNFKTVLDDNSFIPKLHFNVIIDLETLELLEALKTSDAIEILGTDFWNQIKNRQLRVKKE